MRSLNFPVTGADLYAVANGETPSAIFIHGMGDDLGVWNPVLDALGPDFDSFRYDLRGFGRSPCRTHLPFKHADDLRALLDALALDRCDLIGVSMGGGVALNFTLDHPDLVRKLILISPQLVAWEWSEAWLELWRPIERNARAGNLDEAKRLWWEHPLLAGARASAASRLLHDSIMAYSGEQWINDHHDLMFPDIERLHSLTPPTLLLTGGLDFEDFRLTADLIEASSQSVVRIDAASRGHMLHLEDPAGCAANIRAFLKEH